MSDDKFDAIIIGAGLAGCTAGYLLARAGLGVLIVERGNYAGGKNMTGGRLYAHTLEKIIPGFASEAPVERCVTREKVSFLTEDSAVTVDYQAAPDNTPANQSYTVLRAKFDQWLAGKAEEAGAQIITGIRVDELLMKNGAVTGVKAGDDELEGEVTILADGCNSILGEKIGFVKNVTPHNCAVGVKELLELTPEQMADRFGCAGKDGLAWLFAGSPSCGHLGGGFLYTNENTVSLGLVFGLHNVDKTPKTVPQMLEDFKNHPTVKPLVEGGKLLEYSAHVVPEGGYGMIPRLSGDGVLLAGDAAGFCLNVGYTVRGMDLAIASGEAAAKAVLAAKQKNDFSAAALAGYQNHLDDSIVLKDMKRYKNLPGFLDNPRLFNAYPEMLTGLMSDVFTINGPETLIVSKLHKRAQKIGIFNLIKDGFKGARSL